MWNVEIGNHNELGLKKYEELELEILIHPLSQDVEFCDRSMGAGQFRILVIFGKDDFIMFLCVENCVVYIYVI